MQFNSKIDILRVDETTDTYGSRTESVWVLYHDVPCRINWSRGKERIQFDKNTYYRDAKVYCRPLQVSVNDRVRYNDVVYEIVNVANFDNMNRLILLEIKLIQ